MTLYAPGALVTARGREWVILPGSDEELLVLRPLGGSEDDTAAVLTALEDVAPARFPPPATADLGDGTRAWLLRAALRTGFRSSGGPFRSLATLAVEPRAYQYVPLMLALRQSPVRLLIADDVGIGKTIEAGLIAAELIAQGDVRRLAVLTSPALAEQWQGELAHKFAIDAEVVQPSSASRLSRGLMMNESLFERHPYVVVSTDFIKMPTRRAEFLNHCPELVIVDEAHNAVADGGAGAGGRTQRYELLQRVAADPSRHLVLVTATPHSGKEAGFRNLLGLLDPDLASVDLEQVRDRERLARHFVQRRRADIRRYLSEDTVFPSDRLSREAPYRLSREYAAFANRLLEYARGRVADDGSGALRRRIRWWSALALLRAMASSPPAVAATLRTRASSLAARTPEEADALGRFAVLDAGTEDSLEGIDTTPGADLTATEEPSDATDVGGYEAGETARERRRLLELARGAEALVGRETDAKLAALISEVTALLDAHADPIIFCRFIATAEYVAAELDRVLPRSQHGDVSVAAVTGDLPPGLREARIAELVARPGRHVLVATDCLSEGVNLQEAFQAVVHYDLAWNPTRHEQREGRVDRFGQRAEVVRAVTIFGADNLVDRIVLDVLIRKHEMIRRDTGVSVPVPDNSDDIVEALVEGLVLSPTAHPGVSSRPRLFGLQPDEGEQLSFEVGLAARRDRLHESWDSAAERERASRTKYAHEAIHPDEVLQEVTAARAALGDRSEAAKLAVESLRALGAPVRAEHDGWSIDTSALPSGLRDSLPPTLSQPLLLHRDLPIPRGHAVADRSDPTVEAIARYVLDTALDPLAPTRIAARAGAIRTGAVERRTTLLLLRVRLHLDLPGATGLRQVVAEEARCAAFAGPPTEPEWLDEQAVAGLLGAEPDGNLDPDQAARLLSTVTDHLADLGARLDLIADLLAADLLDAHRRVRAGANATRRGLQVVAQHPVDVLGVYLYLPPPAR